MAVQISITAPSPAVRPPATNRQLPATARREGRSGTAPEEAARELDDEVARLLRVRHGELAEPLMWQRPSHRREVESFVAQLAPIRSRIALLASWQREAYRGPRLRLAYAIVWLRLARRHAGEYGPRRRHAPHSLPLRLIRGSG